MKILIAGGAGFVGRNLARHFAHAGHTVTALDKFSMNIGSEANVRDVLALHSPACLVNCGGNKNLQFCEDNPGAAMRINAFAPAMVASVCRQMGVKFITIGSDHAHSDPKTGYGESKQAMERMVMVENKDAIVAVSGHIYDWDCPWIVNWLRPALESGAGVDAWADIVNCPTYAKNLAAMLLDIIDTGTSGVVACLGGQPVNRLELFRAYAKAFGYDEELVRRCNQVCPSPLHPRLTRYGGIQVYSGKVPRITVVEGFAEMAATAAMEKLMKVITRHETHIGGVACDAVEKGFREGAAA